MKTPLLLAALSAAALAPLTAHAQFETRYETGFEAPGFVTGTISGQQGWGVSAVGTSLRANANIVTTAPLSGGQSLQLTDYTGTGSANGTVSGAFSPVFTSAVGQTITSVDIRIDGVTPGAAGGADYFITPQSTLEGLILARVNFNYLGTIRVIDRLTPTAALTYVNTGLNWTAGTTYNVSIVSDLVANSLQYKINGTTVYTSVSGLYAAKSLNQVVLTSDNFQVTGETAKFDNLSVVQAVPEPASMAALGVGALALLRRRRKA